ncbi:hypothetical protein AAE02nite_30970 [Adhaeribacter aerolatus]|uniref:Uncharacterized protein n=1 Tax=Adhaeribacter aerolatus TaxID=670289 RepID=A0A512B0F2_9BACT|nr:hypothetical protein [Adhaeribacter aerolatus]GEO05433.1 hypothetical protein AAE02nite_30970 [Adhaeribacter aerolatus]
MNIKGDILQIKNKRDSKHQDIQIQIDTITYITHKKDGRYFQPFELIDNLQNSLLLTGDQLARSDNKYLEEGEHEFKVYDKAGDNYELNPNKHLLVTLEYDFDLAESILTSVEYSVTVSTEEFKELQNRKNLPKGKDRRNK